MTRTWVDDALRRIEADYTRSADTHLLKLELPAFPGRPIYFKDESTHPTGSLKHRLARSLFLYGLCNGKITEGTTIIEASSGSTAVSEAYFAQMLGLRFIAVVPATTSPEKIRQIAFYGGECHLIQDGTKVSAESHRLAAELGGHFMDQFTNAERATDWRGNNNIAESIFTQMAREDVVVPRWVVIGAGTGGTSATIGRYVRYRRLATRVCVVDPEFSVFYDFFHGGSRDLTSDRGSRIEGIGRPRVEPSFLPEIVDRMIKVRDTASIAAMRLASRLLGRGCGVSTGTNLVGVFKLLTEMLKTGETGPVVTLLCDGAARYGDSYYHDGWLADHGLDISADSARLDAIVGDGIWRD